MVLNTGGTIGMVAGPDGFAPKRGVLEAALAVVDPDARVINFEPLIDSSAATPRDWARIAHAVATADPSDAIVIVHGTDTMAHTAAALTFALKGLARPVILTGSMLPLTVAGSDGEANLRGAIDAAKTAGPGVWLSFAGRVLHGARVRKVHSTGFTAFDASPSDHPPRRAGQGAPVISAQDVEVITTAPGMNARALTRAAQEADGIILRCFGSGTMPDTPALRAALATAQARGIPVVAVSQCAAGGVSLGTYAAGSIMTDHGVIDGRGMTAEAAYAKVMIALSEAPDDPATLIRTPLAGEMD
nr:asparaginase [Rubricella aquisinus]